MKLFLRMLTAILLVLFFTGTSQGDGLLQDSEAKQFLKLSRTMVEVQIIDQIALTTVVHEFLNPVNSDSLDVIYMFPLPANAAMTGLAIWHDSTYYDFKLAESDTGGGNTEYPGGDADPLLMEYLAPNPFIVPVVAREDTVRIRLKYAELLPFDFGAMQYQFPLDSKSFSTGNLDAFGFYATFQTHRTIETIETPGFASGIDIYGQFSARVGYEQANFTPASDYPINYQLAQEEVGLFTLTYRDPYDSLETAGYFLALLEPGDVQPGEILNKHFTFVLDRSGSMSGVKIRQAREAAQYCVAHLNQDDFFNIVDFSSSVNQFQGEAVAATQENILQGVSYIQSISAGGGTNINQALLTALSNTIPNEVNQIIFLTDGLATAGVTDTETILANVLEANLYQTRIFVFGIGNYVGKDLLQGLADQNHGLATYIVEDEPIDQVIVNFFARISNPVLANVSLDFGSLSVYDVFPVIFPDMFAGFQQVITGRYRSAATTDITLSGTVAQTDTSIVYPNVVFPDSSTANVFIPKIWAKKKIDHLYARWLKEGEPAWLKEEIVQLSLYYGILSPFTEYNAPDPPPLTVVEETTLHSIQVAACFSGEKFALKLEWVCQGNIAEIGAIEILRGSNQAGEFNLLAQLPANASTYTDETADPLKNYSYQISVLLLDGSRVTGSVEYEPPVARQFQLLQNYPNPFNPQTRISFFLGKKSQVQLNIFNLQGKRIRTLVQQGLPAGLHQVTWDGKDAFGKSAATGIYFYQLQANGFILTRKMIFAK